MAKDKEAMRKAQAKSVEVRNVKRQIADAVLAGDMERAQRLTALMPTKKPTPKRLYVLLRPEVVEFLERRAGRRGQTVYQVAADIITEVAFPSETGSEKPQFHPMAGKRFA